MSIKVVFVSGMHLNCIWRLSLYEKRNGVRVWSVYELYLKDVLNEHHNDIRIWRVSEMYLKDVLNEYQNDIRV